MVDRGSKDRGHIFGSQRVEPRTVNALPKRPAFATVWQRLLFVIVVSSLIMTSGGHPSAQEGFYTLVPIVDPYLLGFGARDINDSGVVVGAGVAAGTGYIWTQAGGSQPMPLYTDQGFASRLRINNNGVVAGGGCGSGVCQAEIWRADFGEIPLGFFPSGGGNQTSVTAGINDQGQVVGSACCIPGLGWAPFIWSSAAGLQELPGGLQVDPSDAANDI